MGNIHLLDSDTINQIAAGEVVERPASVAKELVENAVDAGAGAVTVEIKEGGIGLIRVTDNGSGIAKEDIRTAFARHATSKIATALDLLSVKSLGFRGEALSSIAAVSMVELVTKTRGEFTGNRYIIEGGAEKELTEIGAPEGTTFLVRTLFYNTPARRKFLKSAVTEAGYISDLMERFAIAHPEISFKFINNGKTVLQTAGNGNLKDCIYHIYGREIAAALVEADGEDAGIRLTGFLGKPVISRGNRNYENYFINGRYIKSNIISKAIEEAYKPYSMQHKYPFTVLHFVVPTENIDVNVHPTKLEVRFTNGEALYQLVYRTVRDALSGKNMIPDALLSEEKRVRTVYQPTPEIFERGRLTQTKEALRDEAARTREAAIKATLEAPIFSAAADEAVAGKGTEHTGGAPEGEKGISERVLREGVPYGGDGGKTDAVRYHGDTGKQEGALCRGDTGKQDGVPYGEEEKEHRNIPPGTKGGNPETPSHGQTSEAKETQEGMPSQTEESKKQGNVPTQLSFFEASEQNKEAFMEQKQEDHHRIIGQLFSTYWLVEFKAQLFIIDQHAAHGKILYEHTVARMRRSGKFSVKGCKSADGREGSKEGFNEFSKIFENDKKAVKTGETGETEGSAGETMALFETAQDFPEEPQALSQMLTPPIILTLSMREEEILTRYMEYFLSLGFAIEAFGGRECAVSAVPVDLYGVDGKALLVEMLDHLMTEPPTGAPDIILDKIASMSCKAAVKGNMRLSQEEAKALIHELLRLENPFHCPHGRPIIISMTKNELEKKFKRIVN